MPEKMSLKINRIYEAEDTDMYGDEIRIELVETESGKKLQVGDYYHDKIEDRIGGFIDCLDHLGIEYSITTEKWRENWKGERVE